MADAAGISISQGGGISTFESELPEINKMFQHTPRSNYSPALPERDYITIVPEKKLQ